MSWRLRKVGDYSTLNKTEETEQLIDAVCDPGLGQGWEEL